MADFDISSSFIPALYKPASLLPITKHHDVILYLVETYPFTIIVGETGSGKTTQIPQFLEKAGWCSTGKLVGITQPRRIAATTTALRVAEEFGCELGKEVGYSIRFEDVTSSSTKIKFVTDGLLIREALVDPLLSRYSVIMVDEAHERSVSTDILLGLLKKIQKRRPELRIIISSATLQAEDFVQYFTKTTQAPDKSKGNGSVQKADEKNRGTNASTAASDSPSEDTKICEVIGIEGRTYPVDKFYLTAPTEDYVERALKTVFDIHTNEPDGDILVFLTGREEIDFCLEAVSERIGQLPKTAKKLLALPLYAGLTTEQQMYVFEKAPEDTRKIIFSTNVAEASVTIDGIVYVIDSGFVKLRFYDANTGIESLMVTEVSKASAMQRAGRAGRTQPGKCFRLYTEEGFNALQATTIPEVQRSNLAPILLQLKALGVDNVLRFDFLSPPPAKLMAKGLELLYSLGALDEYAKLTRPLGLQMAELALEPMMAKTLLAAPSFGCLREILTIAAMTSLGGNVWFSHDGEKKQMEQARRRLAADEGDHLTLLNAYHAFVTKGKKEAKWCHQNHLNFKSMTRAVSIRAQLKRSVERFGLVPDDTGPPPTDPAARTRMTEQIRRCLTTGYFAHAARMQPDGSFQSADGSMTLYAHPTSLMFHRTADWVIYHEIMETANKIFIRDITKIEKKWLLEYAPEYYQVVETSTPYNPNPDT